MAPMVGRIDHSTSRRVNPYFWLLISFSEMVLFLPVSLFPFCLLSYLCTLKKNNNVCNLTHLGRNTPLSIYIVSFQTPCSQVQKKKIEE